MLALRIPSSNQHPALLASPAFLSCPLQHVPSADVETLSSGMLEPEATGGDHPRVAAAKQRLQQRLREQAQ
jgi:hypothetical protein